MMEMENKDYLDCNTYWKEHKGVQAALNKYLTSKGLSLPDNVQYSTGIDFVAVMVDDFEILDVCLPPVSNYNVRETKYTHRFLRATAQVGA